MGGGSAVVPAPAYNKEILTLQIGGDLGITLGLKTAHSALITELEAFAFMMGNG